MFHTGMFIASRLENLLKIITVPTTVYIRETPADHEVQKKRRILKKPEEFLEKSTDRLDL